MFSLSVCARKTGILVVGLILMVPGLALGLQPPEPGELEKYAQDGTLDQRIEDSLRYGNHITDPRLVWNMQSKLLKAAGKTDSEIAAHIGFTPPPSWQGGLPSTGTPKIFVLLVDFPDYPHSVSHTQADVSSKFFGDGIPTAVPYESLRNYYQRSSYSQLTIQGTVFDWYRAQHTRDYYEALGDGPGQEALMAEAMDYCNSLGHDFTQYDNDGDGVIDAFFLKWTGPAGPWASFWWAYQWSWHSTPSYRIDGKALGKYVWSWIANPTTQAYSPLVDIHETGHLLGLPDLYDYNGSIGPDGGVGGFDMMDANFGDHNCFSKYLLDWLTPTQITSGSQTIALNPSGTSKDCVQIVPNIDPGTMFGEFFMVQYRKGSTGNDPTFPINGMVIWHVDSTLNDSGTNFAWNNSYTSHKYIRLMEADGLEEIEQGYYINSGDFYVPGKSFGNTTTPNSRVYSGQLSGVTVDQLTTPGSTMSARFGIDFIPEIVATTSLVSESCQLPNNAIDPMEYVTLDIQLSNVGLADTENLVGSLLLAGGILLPSAPQTYGALTVGGPAVTRPFTFLATGECGGTITVSLKLQDGTTNLGTLVFTYDLGARSVSYSEKFDSVTAPALPAGWTATVGQGSIAKWKTSTAARDTNPNAAFATDPDIISDNYLISPSIPITTSSARLSFRHNYNLETNYDGGVLEIAIGTGGYSDIIAAGGSFLTGGYNRTISSEYQNPIGGRNAWSGSSDGFVTTMVKLPASAAGKNVRLRWRLGTDEVIGATGWYVDTITLEDELSCCLGNLPPPPTGFACTDRTANSITWGWNDDSDKEEGYEGQDQNNATMWTVGANVVSFTEEGLALNTQYTRHLHAHNEDGYSSPSNTVSAYTSIEASTGAEFGAVTTTSIQVKSANTPTNLASGNSGLMIRNKTTSADSGWLKNNNYWTNSSLAPNTPYSFTVQSRNGSSIPTAESDPSVKWTTASAPQATCTKPSSDPILPVDSVYAFNSTAVFGSGGVDHYHYAWNQNPAYVVTDSEPTIWDASTLNLTGSAAGKWYLHLLSHNGEHVPGGSLRMGPYLIGYKITTSAAPAEYGKTTGDGGYNADQSCTVSAFANSGQSFFNWTEDGVVVSNSAVYTFNVTANRNLVANFAPNHKITANPAPSGGGTTSGNGSYVSGISCTVGAYANKGYTFTGWTENGTVVSTSALYTFTVNDNRTLLANFTAGYTVTTSASPALGGTVNGGGLFNSGLSCTVTATANTGYKFNDWTENGNQVSTSASYTFTVTGNRTLVANFAVSTTPTNPTNSSISAGPSPAAGGTTSGGGNYTNGQTCTLTASPSSGFTFANWTENGNVVSTSATYTFAVSGDRTLLANFTPSALSTYTLRIENPSGESVPQTYTAGATVTVTAPAAPDGKYFAYWSGDASGEDNPITVLMDRDKNIRANYEDCNPQLPPCGTGTSVCGAVTLLMLGFMRFRRFTA